VSKSQLPEACAAPGIDRRTLSTTGAISLRRIEGKWVAETARSPYADRPWYGRPAPPDPAVLDRLARRKPAAPASAIDERPRPGDVPVPDVPEGRSRNLQPSFRRREARAESISCRKICWSVVMDSRLGRCALGSTGISIFLYSPPSCPESSGSGPKM
jgi:hypothetical protein